jgi:hypothetical protein
MNVRTQGRLAGLVYLGVVIFGVFALLSVPSKLFVGVDGDAAASAAAIKASPALFAAGNAAAIAMYACFLALPFALAAFLSRHGKLAARLMILFVAASMPFSMLAVGQLLAIAGIAASAAPDIGEVAARLAAYDKWIDLTQIFWGLWLAPLAYLVLKSGAIPRLFGLLLLCGFVEYVGGFVLPRLDLGVSGEPFIGWFGALGSIGEIGTCLWLLIMGARETRTL